MQDIELIVKDVLDRELKSLLHDVTYRIGVLQDERESNGRITSGRLNIAQHMLDGFVFTDNDPVAGDVSWVDCNISYKGQTYTIADGDTGDKYIYWQFGDLLFTTSNVKPTIGADDVLVAINDGGTAHRIIGATQLHGSSLVDLSVDTTEIADQAITSAKIHDDVSIGVEDNSVDTQHLVDGAVTTIKIANDAVDKDKINADVAGIGLNQNVDGSLEIDVDDVTVEVDSVNGLQVKALGIDSAQLASSAVTTAKIANDAVDRDKVASNVAGSGLGQDINGALEIDVDNVTVEVDGTNGLQVKALGIDTAHLASDAVETAKINNLAVTSGKLEADAVIAGKIADGAVDSSSILSNNVVTTAKINNLAVTSDKLSEDAVTSGKIANGAVDSSAVLADNVVVTDKINNGAVTPGKTNLPFHMLF